MSDYMDPNNEELLRDFFAEAQMQVESIERNILALEDNVNDSDAIDELFRAAHTLKGGSATVQMNELSTFAHQMEDVLDEIRGGQVTPGRDIIDALLDGTDVLKDMLAARQDGEVYDEDFSATSRKLRAVVSGEPAAEETPASPSAAEPAQKGGLTEYELIELQEAAGEGETVLQVRVEFDESNPMNSVGGIQIFARLKDFGQLLKTVPDFDALYEDVFHPVVSYYVSTKTSPEELEEKVFLPDVTLAVEAGTLDKLELVPPPAAAAPAAAKTVPAVKDVPKTEAGGQIPPAAEKTPAAPKSPKSSKSSPKTPHKRESMGGSILRVDSHRIDNLLNLVSEAVINKGTFNQLSSQFGDVLTELTAAEARYKDGLNSLLEHLPLMLEELQAGKTVNELRGEILGQYGGLFSTFEDFQINLKDAVNLFRNTSANLARTTGDLHEGILRVRMVPIGQIFSRFPRLVRDLSRSLQKEIELIIEGEETELDKSVTEQLLDPLMHCVRNSLDHGIESVEERRKAGKPEKGRILLKASNQGNMIVIEITDDGAGIDVEKVRKKAVERGLIHPNKTLTDMEAFNIIFDAGFTTAREVTNISGRGVGLDVVRQQIEKLNGHVTVWSKLGEGTRFIIKLPLTLAIIQGLLVRVGTEIYAIPITSVVESLRIRPSEIRNIDNYEVFNVRDDVVSLLRLGRLFRIDMKEDSEYHYVVIVGSGEKKIGLVVDALIGEEDVVIKPLKDRYTNSPGIAGATILGDGTVSLIIDVSQLLDLGVKKEQEARLSRAGIQ